MTPFGRIGRRLTFLITLLAVASVVLSACAEAEAEGYAGAIQIDGSSTVFPISQAVAEEFHREYTGTRISVGLSGTGGGFEKFCRGEIQISDASRPIKEEEIETCLANGIDFTEFAVAADGISIIVNPENDWADCLTVEQLRELWKPDSPIETWSDLNPEWPDEEITLYGPGTDSGTFEYFTEAIVGESGESRADYSASEDDNVLVQGVEGDEHALGYLGFAYYKENQERLKVLGVDNGEGCVTPSEEAIQDNSYAPLSRPVFIYVSNDALTAEPTIVDPEGEEATELGVEPISTVAAFVRYYLTEGVAVIPYVGYVPFDESVYEEQLDKLEAVIEGNALVLSPTGLMPRQVR